MKPQDVKITTTSGFDNAEITEYFYPITAHVVVGMNVFKDFLSGFSDFFGGKSSSYQNTLRSINEDVLKELQKKAHAIGANCVLALKIDNDEVSAQNKSMMMVTALGTAAKADFKQKTNDKVEDIRKESISQEQMFFLKKKKAYLQSFSDGSIKIDDKFWEFAKTNQVKDFAEPLLKDFANKPQNIPEVDKNMFQQFTTHLKELLQTIDHEYVEQILYAWLNDEAEPYVHKRILSVVTDLSLINFQATQKLLQGEYFYQHKNAIQVLKAYKRQYSAEDIYAMDDLVNKISMQFAERAEKTTRKKGFSGKEKEVWICECGNENEMDKTYCSNCKMNIYGFGSFEFKPQEAIEKLINELELLRSVIT